AQFAAWASGGMEGQAPSLQGATGGTGKTQRKAAGQGGLTGSPMLSKGPRGRLVVLLQQKVNEHGSNLGTVGIFGKVTDRAVKRFQRSKGLHVDGIVGPRTATSLNGSSYRGAEGRDLAPEVSVVPTPRPDRPEDQSTEEPSVEESAPTLSGKPEVSQGDMGPKVRVLQDLLSSAGFRVAVDGEFGANTDRAVRAYQRSRGLFVDGKVGPKTAAALSSNKAAVEAPSLGPAEGLDPDSMKSFDPAGRLSDSRVNPTVAGMAANVCRELQKLGYQPYVVQGHRSFEEQNEIYKQGRTKPGAKVTWVKGGGSWHQYGLAVDIAFWNSSGNGPSWSEKHPWHLIGSVGKAAGFSRWGGDFGDRPHLEHHPGWGNKASSLASTYHSQGLAAVWKKVGL
ncbi:MAG: peptidoglycan-binding protein, partial [Myxococcota bacterium]